MPRKRLPVSEKKLPVAARVHPTIFHALMDMAAADDRKLAYMVEKALREFVERHGGGGGQGGGKGRSKGTG